MQVGVCFASSKHSFGYCVSTFLLILAGAPLLTHPTTLAFRLS
jgi:hypothetical protein